MRTDSIRPWVLHMIEAFGPDRIMFGTNWPVDILYATYLEQTDAYRRIGALEILAVLGILVGVAAVGKAGILSPIMAGWAPNILAAGTAAYLLLTART